MPTISIISKRNSTAQHFPQQRYLQEIQCELGHDESREKSVEAQAKTYASTRIPWITTSTCLDAALLVSENERSARSHGLYIVFTFLFALLSLSIILALFVTPFSEVGSIVNTAAIVCVFLVAFSSTL